MKVGWLIGFFMLYAILTPICGALDGSFYPISTMEHPSFFYIVTNPSAAILNAFNIWTLVQSIWQLFTFGYIMFSGAWIIIRIFLLAIAGGFLIAFLLSLKGTPSTG